MRDRLRESNTLPHTFTESRDLTVRRFHHRNAFECVLRQRGSFLFRVTVNAKIELDELAGSRTAWKRIELRTIAELLKDRIGPVRRNPEDPDMSTRRLEESGHQIHQGRLAR